MKGTAIEANLDGLVGPTHNYAGLSFGNEASEKYALSVSNPKQAALQGLKKMKFVHDLGLPQFIMPPQPRPVMELLKQKGYANIADAPSHILYPLYSASSMWVANAATVSPSADTKDGKVHFTPANLMSKFHRALETRCTANYLKQIFPSEHFVHHTALPAEQAFADEGAANHMQLCSAYGQSGTEIFVYGGASQKYPARQSRRASEAIIKAHSITKTILLEQSAEAIDAGVFHNDVIAMSNESLLIHHEKAYSHVPVIEKYRVVVITEKELPLKEAITTYFFNSQLITLLNGQMVVIAPSECEENTHAKACFERLMQDGYISQVYYLDVRESMKNGGGPACLRLRIILTPDELNTVHKGVRFTDAHYATLCRWIEKHYRDRLSQDDLRDEALAQESERALAELSMILKINIGHHTLGVA